MMPKARIQKIYNDTTTVPDNAIPTELYEVCDTPVTHDSIYDVAKFLGIVPSTIHSYLNRNRTSKIVKSKLTGKVYVIRKQKVV